MNESWSEKEFLEECKRKTFQELLEYIEKFLDNFSEELIVAFKNSAFNGEEFFQKIWSLLEDKVSDGFGREKNSVVREYLEKRPSLRRFSKKKIQILSEQAWNVYFRPQRERRHELIVRLRSKKRKIFEKVKFEIIPFDIFPKGETTISSFIKNLRSSGMSISNENEMRLHRICEAFPDYQSICVGKDKFKGFVVFRFENTDVVIVEKPFYGNATYIVKGDWEKEVIEILQLSRNDARARYHKQVKRVIHTSERQWLLNLKSEFKYWY